MPIIIFGALIIIGIVALLIFRAKSRATDRKIQAQNAKR